MATIKTQEESLCQRSDLGLLLEKRKYPIPNDSYHYIPKVTITSNKICCAIIASELRSVACHNAEYLANRIIALYECALKNKHDAIVLGAWGCGAFRETEEDAIIMANIFRQVEKTYRDRIRTVYAVLYENNYQVFKKIIEQPEKSTIIKSRRSSK